MAEAVPRPGEEITSGTLFRRIPNDVHHWVPAPEDRPASYNFIPDNKDEFLSVHWSDRTAPAEIFARYPGCGLLKIPVADVRSLGYRVELTSPAPTA